MWVNSFVGRVKFLPYDIEQLVLICGSDILNSPGMEYEKTQIHHTHVSRFEHSVAVAYISIWLVKIFRLKVDLPSLVRGALLHDYFLYEMPSKKDKQRLSHSFNHSRIALQTADEDFCLNKIERDIIVKHMYPLTPKPPRYRESIIVCIADKLSAVMETILPAIITSKSPPGIKVGKKLL